MTEACKNLTETCKKLGRRAKNDCDRQKWPIRHMSIYGAEHELNGISNTDASYEHIRRRDNNHFSNWQVGWNPWRWEIFRHAYTLNVKWNLEFVPGVKLLVAGSKNFKVTMFRQWRPRLIKAKLKYASRIEVREQN